METTRAIVIEKAVGFEELISQLLTLLLDVEINSSKSFASKSTALSFNTKINLLIDLKLIPAELSKDFQLFAEIRNKFAHILYVDSFIKCFEIIHDKKNNFLKRMSNIETEVEDEITFASFFEILCLKLSLWLTVTLQLISNKKKSDLNKVTAIEITRNFTEHNSKITQKNWDIYLKTIKPIIDKILTDEEFITDYNKLSKANTENKH